MSRIDLVPKFIMACCVLHNLGIQHYAVMEEDERSDADGDSVDNDVTVAQSGTSGRQLAVAKRNYICAQLP